MAFLSRLPVPARFFEGHDGTVARACRAFPLAGALIALPPALLFLVFTDTPFVNALAALTALGVLAILCGGLHEDGLADAADGLGGGRDKEHALSIMKDSRIGSYGVIALILSFGLRFLSLAALAVDIAPQAAAGALIASAALGRAFMVWHWSALPPARTTGTAVAAGTPERRARSFAGLSALAIAAICLIPTMPITGLCWALALSWLAAYLFTRFVRNKLGGHTGDTIGATEQIAEIAFLCALAATL